MSQTATSTEPAAADVDAARELITDALCEYAEKHVDPDVDKPDVELAASLAANVKGWTHTTRLREYLEAASRR